MDVGRFIEKIKEIIPIEDITSVLERLPNDPTLMQISENAGTIGGVIKIALHITDKVYKTGVSVDKRLSLTLMRIMLESAVDSLPYSVSNTKVEDILGKKGNGRSEEFEKLVLELLDSKYNQYIDNNQRNIDAKISTYLPDHPVFIKFKDLLSQGIKTINHNHGYDLISVPVFLTEFNSNVVIKLEEEKAKNDKDLENLLHKWKTHKDFGNLQLYLKNARNVFFEKNPIDGKSLSEYYIENKTYKVDKQTWGYDEEKIEKKGEWSLDSFLKSNNSVEVIAAPFGIGKSSLAKKMSHDCAIKFVENPTDPKVYIPIFVPLKFALEVTCNGNKSLENDLERIASYSSRKNETNILVILDGLDELPDNKPINNQTIYTTIQQGFIKSFPNSKYLITTRLEADFPERLNITEYYVRLFSFNDNQIKLFFKNYGLQNRTNNNGYEDISKI